MIFFRARREVTASSAAAVPRALRLGSTLGRPVPMGVEFFCRGWSFFFLCWGGGSQV